MPYLPVDLDAKRKAEFVDRSFGLPRGTTIGGLLDAWEHVWRTKTAILGDLYVTGCFGPDLRVRAAVVEAGFLEPMPDGQWRVRGAEKWLFGMEGRSRGGHAAKGNLVPGSRQKKSSAQPGESREPKTILSAPAETQPRPSRDPLSAHISALTASSQQPTDKEKKEESAVAEVFGYWIEKFGLTAQTKLTEDRRRKIRARLREGFTPERLKLAIDGCAASQWHRENGEVDLELICRSASKTDRFIQKAQLPPSNRQPAPNLEPTCRPL